MRTIFLVAHARLSQRVRADFEVVLTSFEFVTRRAGVESDEEVAVEPST